MAYDITLYILAGLLVLGFICNLLVRPVADKYFMTDAQLAAEQALGHDKGADVTTSPEWKAAPGSRPFDHCRVVGGGHSPVVGCGSRCRCTSGAVSLIPVVNL